MSNKITLNLDTLPEEITLPCPQCSSKRTYQLEGQLVEDVGTCDFRLGTKILCFDCGHDWEEWE
jgi:hypothetical protein